MPDERMKRQGKDGNRLPHAVYAGLALGFILGCADPPLDRLQLNLAMDDTIDVSHVVVFMRVGEDSNYATGAVVRTISEVRSQSDSNAISLTLTPNMQPGKSVLIAVSTCSGAATCSCDDNNCTDEQRAVGPDCRCDGFNGFGAVAGQLSGLTTLSLNVEAISPVCDLDGDLIPDCGDGQAGMGCCTSLVGNVAEKVSDCCDDQSQGCKARAAHPFKTREVGADEIGTPAFRLRHRLMCGDDTDNDCRGGDEACADFDGDGVAWPEDCNDEDPDINPRAVEDCTDDIDENCDGLLQCDGDGDGVLSDQDCDDSNPDRFPGNAEICGDGIDQDCDPAEMDAPCLDALDVDGDGFICPRTHLWLVNDEACSGADSDCNDLDSSIFPGAPERCGDGFDQDCDGVIDEGCPLNDNDHDGYIDAAQGGLDCNDNDASVAPGKPEYCDDGIDQDCDGVDTQCTRENDRDLDRWPGDIDCGDNDANVYPGATEYCNGRDDDCDGYVDEGNPLRASANSEEAPSLCGAECSGGPCACRRGRNACTSFTGSLSDGSALDSSIRCFGLGPAQAGQERCDGLDDNCDGVTDNVASEACYPGPASEWMTESSVCSQGETSCMARVPDSLVDCVRDEDCPGDSTCVGATCGYPELPTCVGFVAPEAVEVCGGSAAGSDEDCDGRVDEDIPMNSCGSNVGECQSGVEICQNGALVCEGASAGVAEVCDGLDNDCDDQVDEVFNDLGGQCFAGQGQCRREGRNRCRRRGDGIECDARAGEPEDEECDGVDNDCDGNTDEEFGQVGQGCSVGQGACTRNGRYVCSRDGDSAACDVEPGNPTEETCDGQDNDCDGDADEGFSLGDQCSVGDGPCRAEGQLVCSRDGQDTECNAQPNQGMAEACDGRDNDCDGETDEAGAFNSCNANRADNCSGGECRCGEELSCEGRNRRCQNGECVDT